MLALLLMLETPLIEYEAAAVAAAKSKCRFRLLKSALPVDLETAPILWLPFSRKNVTFGRRPAPVTVMVVVLSVLTNEE